jgi:hypothetical protein
MRRHNGENFYLFIKRLTLEYIKSDDVVTLAFDYIPNSKLPAIPYMVCGSVNLEASTAKHWLSIRGHDQSNDGYENRQMIERVLKKLHIT